MISRIKLGKQFKYLHNGKEITNQQDLDRIKKLCIPPNWKDVVISPSKTNYLQVQGKDISGKTQYIYHPLWVTLSKVQKYSRLKLFIQKLPLLLKRVDNKLSGKMDLSDYEYIIALVFRILDITHARIGNDCYADENNTYGLTTLLKKHLTMNDSTMNITFKYIGKKNVPQCITFRDPKVYKILKELIKIPGNRLFKTSDLKELKSADMNKYMKIIMGGDFTCKDFRTYASNKLFIDILKNTKIDQGSGSESDLKKNVRRTYDLVAKQLGHTETISKKSYVLDLIPQYYVNNPRKFVETDSDKLFEKILLEH
jgi:DNA topoisomerase-1